MTAPEEERRFDPKKESKVVTGVVLLKEKMALKTPVQFASSYVEEEKVAKAPTPAFNDRQEKDTKREMDYKPRRGNLFRLYQTALSLYYPSEKSRNSAR